MVRPASLAIPPIVYALMGLWTGNREDSHAIGHDHVLALAQHTKASLLECPDGILMIDARDLGHALRDVDFAYDGPLE